MIEYRKGLTLKMPANIRYHSEVPGYADIYNPPVIIRVDSNPDFNYLTVGPILPIPIIPWVPGIVDVIRRSDKYQIPQDALRIRLSFKSSPGTSMSVTSGARPVDYIFTPSDSILVVSSQTLNPVDVRWDAASCSGGNHCDRLTDGRYAVSVASSTFPSCVLTYGIKTSDVNEANLKLSNLLVQGEKENLSVTLKRGPTIRVGYLGP